MPNKTIKMKTLLIRFSLAFVFICFCGTSATAQKIFLKIDGIEGESTNPVHLKEIDVISFGEQMSSCGPTGTGCSVTIGNFIYNMELDKSITAQRQKMLTRAAIPSATFSFNYESASGLFEYYKIKLENVIISAMSESTEADSVSGKTKFQISIDAQTITWTTTILRPDGSSGGSSTYTYTR